MSTHKPVSQVVSLLKNAGATSWGDYFEFEGTREDLIAAGLATPDMFENMGVSGVRKRHLEFGDSATVSRRPKGRWRLSMSISEEITDAMDEHPRVRKAKWWLAHGPESIAIVEKIIAGFAKQSAGGTDD
jgi:hypothetical protein